MSYLNAAKAHFSREVREKNGIKIEGHRDVVHSVAWNSTGSRLASGSNDNTARIFSVKNGKTVKLVECTGHSKGVDQLCWNPSHAEQMATASGDKTVRIWDARGNGRAANVIETKGENINISWSPDGNAIAVGNKSDHISFIDTRTMKIFAQKDNDCEINEIKWNQSGDTFFMTTGEGTIHVLDYPTLEHAIAPLPGHTANCICIEFDPKGRYFATGSADTLTSLWNVNELICIRTFARAEWPIRNLSFSFDGQLLAAASEDQAINITYIETGDVVHKIETPDGTFSVAWHPTQLLLAFAGDEKARDGDRAAGTIRLFGVAEKSRR